MRREERASGVGESAWFRLRIPPVSLRRLIRFFRASEAVSSSGLLSSSGSGALEWPCLWSQRYYQGIDNLRQFLRGWIFGSVLVLGQGRGVKILLEFSSCLFSGLARRLIRRDRLVYDPPRLWLRRKLYDRNKPWLLLALGISLALIWADRSTG